MKETAYCSMFGKGELIAVFAGIDLDKHITGREFDFLSQTFADATTGESAVFAATRETSQLPYVVRVTRLEWAAFLARGGNRESCWTPRIPLPHHSQRSGLFRAMPHKAILSEQDAKNGCGVAFLRAAKRAFFRDDSGRVDVVFFREDGGVITGIDRWTWNSLRLSRATSKTYSAAGPR